MADPLFHLPPGSQASLQAQIREMLIAAILDGHLPVARPLPSSRRLASQLGVSRNTVVLAYEHLVEEGYLVARERSGYFIDQDILSGRVADNRQPPQAPVSSISWTARFRVRASTQRNIIKPRDWQRFRYPFIYGQIDPALMPVAEWRECCREALSARAMHSWARDYVDKDDPLLVDELRRRVLPRRGVRVDADEILITLGAQQALYIVARLLVAEDIRVGVEDPGYPDARNIMQLRTPHLHTLSVDGGGLVVDSAIERCDYVYVTPSHQCPTMVTMPLARRQALLERAAQSDFVVIEDDYECETNYATEPIPALKSLDRDGRVIYVGSLSKALAPGIRVGYLVAPRELIREARALRRLMLRHPPSNNERTVALFLTRGHYDSLMRRLSHSFSVRWKVMRRCLAQFLPSCRCAPSVGGTAFWVQCPERLDTRALADLAAEQGIIVEPGEVYFQAADAPRNFMRLGFSSIGAERIEEGLRALGEIVDQQVARWGRDNA